MSKPKTVAQAGITIAGVTLTNPDKVLYPEQGITKELLARYYERVADWILPHVVRRPLSIVRCPEGHERGCFFQKHATGRLPQGVRGIPIREKEGRRDYFAIDDLTGLISLVQLGVLEIHPWGSREEDVERPDRVIFDLDPGPGIAWPALIEAARRVREALAALKLESFVKTSGGKGLHVVLPIVPGPDWDQVKTFAQAVAAQIARQDPNQYTTVMKKSQRSGRIFIDYLRNSRGATTIAPYSTRARPGAPVSLPLRWDELSKTDGAAAYTLKDVPRRLARRKKDPWEGFFTLRQSLPI